MQITLPRPGHRRRQLAAAVLALGLGLALFWRPVAQAAGLALGGAALAFLICPLAAWFEKRFNRPTAALLGIVAACLVVGLALWLALPTIVREIGQLGELVPRSAATLTQWAQHVSQRIERHMPGVKLPEPGLDGLADLLTGLASGAAAFVGSFADGLSRLSLMLMLCYFFLRDRDRLLLRLELCVPLSHRAAAVRAGRAITRELRLYLQGQLTVAALVGALAAAGLALAGVRSALVLGGVVGVLNMVPYFGPFIGGIPAVLAALGDGWRRAALCLGALALVQQIDNALISPRVMGSLTGFSPAAVLLAIYGGASLGGIGGMLAALPLLMAIRTVFRVFVQNRENI